MRLDIFADPKVAAAALNSAARFNISGSAGETTRSVANGRCRQVCGPGEDPAVCSLPANA